MLLYVPLFPGKAKLLIASTVQFLIHKAFLFFPYQAMVKEASTYLFNATKQRFFFKAIFQSDYVVFRFHICSCSSTAKVFVHEWAHLRWGVFDEYNNDAPFYVSVNSGKASVEATRCSASVTGKYIVQSCTGNSCTTRECKSDEQTKLYEAGCKFVPEKTQNAPASIMYMQSLPSVVEFCDQSTHNEKATNLQNKMCNYHSTWEVIMNSMDFSNTSPINSASPPFETAFSLLQTKDRVVCLVLDVSGSMDGNNRIKRLKQAAEIFLLQVIETGSWVGIVTFHSTAQIETYLQQIINENVRRDLTEYLPISAGGGTNICAGVHKGFEVKENIGENYSNLYGSEIVLLTDGEDGGMSSCLTEVKNSGSIIHTIALGPNAAPELEQFSNMTGGLRFYATDTVDSNGLIDAFSGISSGSGNISEQSIQLESTAQSVTVKQWMNGTVTVDSTVGKDTFFVVTWDRSTSPPDILLRDPKGKEYRTSNFTVSDLNLRTARLNIAGTAEVGDWYYWIQNKHTDSQVISMIVTSRAASLAVPPVTVKALMNKDTNNFPNPMVIYAEVSQGFLPVLGATVMATVEPQTGSAVELKLLDDGSGADITKNDGVYSKYFTSFRGNGRYNLKVRVQGKDKTVRLRRRQSRALYVPGYIENGEIKMNAPRPEPSDDEIQAKLGSFNRVASGGSFVMENVPSGGTTDVFPPCKIIDLEAQYEEDKIHLSWTAPGNDFDVGQGKYIIKMSESLLDLRNTFEDATSVNTSSLVPKPAGTKESFQFKSENVTIENGTIIYFAIRAIDNASLTSEVSNIAQAALFIPPKESSPDSTPNDDVINEGINVLTIVLIVAGSIIAVSIAVSMIVCILHKKNRRGAVRKGEI
uniref:Calcium-activated chloride channel regulator 4-like n=1 Tax=Terrapene triunguis TaxID=2587831 RepID=A0A674J1Z0_9SAUR